MNLRILLLLLLAYSAVQALADELSDATTETRFMTERGAQITLTKVIDTIEASVPTRIPELLEYVGREGAFGNGRGPRGSRWEGDR